MTTSCCDLSFEVENRALQSQGTSDAGIYEMAASALSEHFAGSGILVDVGCGSGQLRAFVSSFFDKYVGVDVIRYGEFPDDCEFHQSDLNKPIQTLPDNCSDAVTALEIVEHLENPRALFRELVRIVKPGGLILVSTPNQLSFLSLLTLVVKHLFSAFQDVHYPAHLTSLLEVDLRRIAEECGLEEISFSYTLQGRMVLSAWHYPRFLSRRFPRALSDNLMLIGRKALD